MREPTNEELEIFTKHVESIALAIKGIDKQDTDEGCSHGYRAEVLVTAMFKASDGKMEDVLHYFKHVEESMNDVLQKVGQKLLSNIELHGRRN